MFNTYFPFFSDFMQQEDEINAKIDAKIEETKKLYFECLSFPRKKKKKLKKQLLEEYSFHVSMRNWKGQYFF